MVYIKRGINWGGATGTDGVLFKAGSEKIKRKML